MIKTYKRYSAARKAANGRPVVKIGSIKAIYCVIDGPEDVTKLIEVALISGKGMITGHVTLEHRTGLATQTTRSPVDRSPTLRSRRSAAASRS